MEIDPLDPTEIINAAETIVIACADPEYRELLKSLAKFSKVIDIYRDPELLLLRLFEIPCFFRLLDYAAYKAVEAEFIAYLSVPDPSKLVPSVVYGVDGQHFLKSSALIDGHATDPKLLGDFFISHRRNSAS